MEQRQVGLDDYRRLVLAYHELPVVTALVLVGVFLACFFLTESYLLSSLAAGIPSAPSSGAGYALEGKLIGAVRNAAVPSRRRCVGLIRPTSVRTAENGCGDAPKNPHRGQEVALGSSRIVQASGTTEQV